MPALFPDCKIYRVLTLSLFRFRLLLRCHKLCEPCRRCQLFRSIVDMSSCFSFYCNFFHNFSFVLSHRVFCQFGYSILFSKLFDDCDLTSSFRLYPLLKGCSRSRRTTTAPPKAICFRRDLCALPRFFYCRMYTSASEKTFAVSRTASKSHGILLLNSFFSSQQRSFIYQALQSLPFQY